MNLPNITFSESTTAIIQALGAVFNEVESAKKDSDNPFHKSKYADLAAVADVAKPVLIKHGLFVIQPAKSTRDNETGLTKVSVGTSIIHTESQEFATNILEMDTKSGDPQEIGKLITYCRRYAIGAMLFLVSEEDDDGNSASGAGKPPQRINQPRNQATQRGAAPAATNAAPPSAATVVNGPDDAKQASERNAKIMEMTGVAKTEINKYFAGCFGGEIDKSATPAMYIPMQDDLIGKLSADPAVIEFFKKDPMAFGKAWLNQQKKAAA